MSDFFYVYILVNEANSKRRYIGMTSDLTKRLLRHNASRVRATQKHRPWRIKVAIAFPSRTKAAAFERYLKTHSGRAFAAKRF